jgi:hypothetical protein
MQGTIFTIFKTDERACIVYMQGLTADTSNHLGACEFLLPNEILPYFRTIHL